jgi:hypothetical protein
MNTLVPPNKPGRAQTRHMNALVRHRPVSNTVQATKPFAFHKLPI